MPTLNWIGKDKVITHHQDVPYRVLEHKYGYKDGKQSNKETGSGNMIIHGDNLEALKALLPKYQGKISCIYIDPPYNTGNEKWVYNDNVNDPKIKKWLGEVVGKEGEDLSRHDKWLCMMYPRLVLLKKLLSDKGVIFISIDDNEQGHLRLICDEIFGANNFIANIIWQKKYTQSNDAKYLSNTHDFILCYASKKAVCSFNLLERIPKQLKAYKNPDNDIRGAWMSQPIQVKTPSEAYMYEIITPVGKTFYPPRGRSWQFSKERYQELVADNRIWFGKDGHNVPRIKTFLSEVKGGVIPKTIWLHEEVGHNDEAKQTIKQIFPDNVFDTPKPERLIERIIRIASNEKAIILDSFAGSGTTAHAILNLNKQDGGNRSFILVEMEDYAETITAERVKRVINGYADVEGTGGAFDYYELGDRLFLDDGNLNEAIGVDKIREYIYFTETQQSITAKPPKGNEFLLGEAFGTLYYFYYEKDKLTTLSQETLRKIVKKKAEQYVIYADVCTLTEEEMSMLNVIFKKIPRDIKMF